MACSFRTHAVFAPNAAIGGNPRSFHARPFQDQSPGEREKRGPDRIDTRKTSNAKILWPEDHRESMERAHIRAKLHVRTRCTLGVWGKGSNTARAGGTLQPSFVLTRGSCCNAAPQHHSWSWPCSSLSNCSQYPYWYRCPSIGQHVADLPEHLHDSCIDLRIMAI